MRIDVVVDSTAGKFSFQHRRLLIKRGDSVSGQCNLCFRLSDWLSWTSGNPTFFVLHFVWPFFTRWRKGPFLCLLSLRCGGGQRQVRLLS